MKARDYAVGAEASIRADHIHRPPSEGVKPSSSSEVFTD